MGFRKWRQISYASPPSSTLQIGTLDLYNNDVTTRCRTPPSSATNNQTSSKKQYPPSPDLYLSGIGDYTFIKQIGQGKFSKVFLAHHYQTKQPVAIKMIDKRAHRYGIMSRLAREIELLEALDHPNIVQLYETHETADTLFIVMEYIEGCSLEDYLNKRRTLSEAEARFFFRQLVAALDYCHSKSIVHRDIKAPNVLLTQDKQIKIVDFGLGNKYGRKRLKTICGSKLYYSPEIINGQGYTGPEIDCWCLGVLLFRMTVGHEPFAKAKTMGELKRDVTAGNFNIPHTLSPELQHAILKCMSIDKSKRSRISTALKDDPWLSNHGQLVPDIFQQDARIETSSSRHSTIVKTITCHPEIPCVYFTSTIPHSSKPEDILHNSQAEHYQTMTDILLQTQLSKKSSIRHLLRKIKPNHRQQHRMKSVAKDQIHDYSCRSGTDEFVIMRLVQSICNSMGITYHRETHNRLACVLNNSTTTTQTCQWIVQRDSKFDSSHTSFSSMTSERSSASNKFKRALSSFLAQFHSSHHHQGEFERQDTCITIALFSITVNVKDNTTITLKLSQLEGSCAVFRMVCNEFTNVLG